MKLPRGEVTAIGTLIMFLAFLVVLGGLWLATGGPERTGGQGPFLTPPWLWNTGDSYTVPGISVIDNNPPPENAPADTPPPSGPSFFDTFFGFRGTTETRDSPYAGMVGLERGNVTASDPNGEYIVIRTARNLERGITISGWTLEEDANTLSVKVGQAVELSFQGQVNTPTPITLPPDSRVYVTTGRSPNGFSFRANQCTGYFEQFQNFSPRLPIECPYPGDEILRRPEVVSGNASCADFVGRLPRCQVIVNTPPATEIGGSCQNFILNELSYNGCVNAHKSEPGFYKNEWRLFLNRDQEIWRNQYERIRLLDENGKTVDVIGY